MNRVLVLGIALTAVGCGEATATPASSSTPAPSASSTASAGAAAPVVKVQSKDKVGKVLTNAAGLTLYYFTPDASANAPTCTGGCAATWPPLTTTRSPAISADGATGADGTVTRADGTTQIKYNGWPLYTYSTDKDSGDVYGEGVGGVWHAARVTLSSPVPVPASTATGTAPY